MKFGGSPRAAGVDPQGERSVDALAGLTGLTMDNTSRHLQQLRQAGLIVGRKQGQ